MMQPPKIGIAAMRPIFCVRRKSGATVSKSSQPTVVLQTQNWDREFESLFSTKEAPTAEILRLRSELVDPSGSEEHPNYHGLRQRGRPVGVYPVEIGFMKFARK